MTAAFAHPSYEPDHAPAAPILVVGDTANARARARRTAEGLQRPLIADLSASEAIDCLDERVRLSALWIELDEAPGPAERRLLHRADKEVRRKDFGVAIAMPHERIDEVLCELSDFAAIEF